MHDYGFKFKGLKTPMGLLRVKGSIGCYTLSKPLTYITIGGDTVIAPRGLKMALAANDYMEAQILRKWLLWTGVSKLEADSLYREIVEKRQGVKVGILKRLLLLCSGWLHYYGLTQESKEVDNNG